MKGYTPTSFIDHHYPDGFSGAKLSELERKQLVAIAREISKKRSIVMGSPLLALSGSDGEETVVVCLGGMHGDPYLVESKIDLERECSITASVTKLKNDPDDANASLIVELCNFNLNYEPSNDLAHISLSGEERALQASHFSQNITRRMHNSSFHCLVGSWRRRNWHIEAHNVWIRRRCQGNECRRIQTCYLNEGTCSKGLG